MLTRTEQIAGTTVVLYATNPAGPWASHPDDLHAWRVRLDAALRGEVLVTFDGKPMESAERGRLMSIRARRGHARRARR